MDTKDRNTCGRPDGDGRNGNEHSQTPGISQRKLEANRANSRKSTGPKTVRGKNISRFNALKHGAYLQELLIQHGKHLKGYERFKQLSDELQQQLAAGAYLEDKVLIQMFVMALWRMDLQFEVELHGDDCDAVIAGAEVFPTLSRTSVQVFRNLERMYDRVQQLRQRAEEVEEAEAAEAEAFACAHAEEHPSGAEVTVGEEPPEQDDGGDGVKSSAIDSARTAPADPDSGDGAPACGHHLPTP